MQWILINGLVEFYPLEVVCQLIELNQWPRQAAQNA